MSFIEKSHLGPKASFKESLPVSPVTESLRVARDLRAADALCELADNPSVNLALSAAHLSETSPHVKVLGNFHQCWGRTHTAQ